MDAGEAYWASWFWKRAGGRSAPPVDIGYAATCALAIGIRPINGLTTSTATGHLENIGFLCADGLDERELHGCIAVGPRGAMILVEMRDDDSQQRFTIAHEVSHYILEVHRHHRRAAQQMGQDYVDILYGARTAAPSERIDAWLNNVRSSAITHFMDRDPNGSYGCGNTLEAECSADRLAIEILAPRAEMARVASDCGKLPFRNLADATRRIAEQRFGLPGAVAAPYAGRIAWGLTGGPSTAERFGLVRES